MRRAVKWAAIALLILLLAPLAAVAGALLFANSPSGARLIERQTASLTGGAVQLLGVAASLPDALRIGRIELRDSKGVWLTIEDAALLWSPSRLVSGVAVVDDLTARRIAVLRLPVSSGGSSGGGFSFPIRVDGRHVAAARIDLAPAVAGTAVALSLDGAASGADLDDVDLDAKVRDLDSAGAYRLIAAVSPQAIKAHLTAEEPAHGAAARAAGLPDLGPLTLNADLNGPRAAIATNLALAAGPLRVAVQGRVDLVKVAANLDATASAAAMAPAPGLAFQALNLTAHVAGPLTAPEASGRLVLDGLASSGASVRRLAADASGSRGSVDVRATAEGARIPGPQPGLIEADPVNLTADLRLDHPDLPFTFTLSHPLLTASGGGHVSPHLAATAHLTAPDLAPFAALGGVALKGGAVLDASVEQATAITATIDGAVSLTEGPAPAPALIGTDARIGLTASLSGSDVAVSRLKLDGAALNLTATGAYGATVALDAAAELPDLAALAPTLSGHATLRATSRGKPDNLSLDADLDGDVATKGTPSGHVTASVRATGLPGAPAGTATAEGQLDGAPLTLSAAAERSADGAATLRIDRADWRSAHAEGALALAAGAKLPTGRIELRMTRLDDLRRLIGQPISGAVDGAVELSHELVTAKFVAKSAGIPGSTVDRATLDARIGDPLGAANVQATLAASGVRAGGATGNGRVTVSGPRNALDVRLQADAPRLAAGPASLTTRALVDVDQTNAAISAFQLTARGQTLRLLGPTRVTFGEILSVDRARFGLRDAALDVSGRVMPTLALTVSLRNLRADLAAVIDPSLAADGVVAADARLSGTIDRPTGSISVTASGLRMRAGPGRALAPASLTAAAALAGRTARVDATLNEGANHLTLTGTAPFDATSALDLRAVGGLDLAVLDPLVSASGRRVRGRLAIDAGISGTLTAPRPSGTVRLTGGEVQDFAQGVHVDRIQAVLVADGDSVRVQQLDGRAGNGTLSASGAVGLGAGMPVDLHLGAKGATPLASDLVTAMLDADLNLRGALRQRLDLTGTITIHRAEIRVPEKLPASVPVLNVIRPGAPPPPPAPAPLVIGLEVTVASPGQIFVRGRGLDAELAGHLTVRGTTAQPLPDGTFTLRRGTFSVVGKTLTFTTGEVGFNGGAGIDPTLNFVATSTSSNIVATLTVTGVASDPKIVLSSVPELPQDEVLARLLFGTSASQLGPFELAEIAAALAQFSGVTSGGFDPLNSIRRELGLDRLSVGGTGSGNSPNVEAGRYVSPGVYVGARQATSGGGTQAVVQVDLYKGLKLEATAGTGGGSAQGTSQTAAGSTGTGVGVTYQFEY